MIGQVFAVYWILSASHSAINIKKWSEHCIFIQMIHDFIFSFIY
jgi:hypothetical protein